MSEKEDIAGYSLPQEKPLLLKREETDELETKIQVITDAHGTQVENEIQKSYFKKHCPSTVDVQWENISYSVSMGWFKEKKMILKEHFGQVRAGEMTAILGPSGSGKTTLLKILSGYTCRNITGRVALNSRSQMKNSHGLLSRFIMQEEEVPPYLTVKEVLDVAARLKVRSEKNTDHQKIVFEVIEALALTECQNTKTKQISGGERKRLSIAQELVSNPPVLFLDEPTSGLDSTTCFDLVRLLKQLSNKGHTIICTIHQPSASMLELFDKLYVMSKGECVYQDSVSALLPFLESQGLQCPQYNNPADYMLEVVSGLYGSYNEQLKCAMISKFTEKESDLIFKEEKEEMQTVNHRGAVLDYVQCDLFKFGNFAVSPVVQFHVLLLRTYKSILRNPFLTLFRLIVQVWVALIIGLLYWKVGDDASRVIKNTAFIYFSHFFCMMAGVTTTVLTFPCEMSIFLREQVNKWYSPLIYYTAKAVADFPFQVMFTAIFSSIVYWMTGQPPDGFRFQMFLLFTIMTALVAQSFGLIIGAATTVEVALFVAPFIIGMATLFSDYFLEMSIVPSYFQWIPSLSYFSYAFQGTMQVIYGFNRTELHCPDFKLCHVTDPEEYLQFLEVHNVNVWYDILALAGFMVLVRAIGYGVLKWKIYFRK